MKQSYETLPPVEQNFPVVGIGASAGGLSAFKKLLDAIPVNSGMAYVLVQHLHPDHESNLVEILKPYSKIPVHEIINDINLVPDNIYVIPQNNNLVTVDGVLQLEKRRRGTHINRAIDIFFESLAEVHKSFAVGVVLSGTAFDGTMGLKKIKEYGGATLAQDPESAEFKSMPQSAIDSDAADYVLLPENIPAQLIEINSSYETSHAYSEEDNIPEDEVMLKIINTVFLRTGNDFKHYKQPTIRRRVARRMVVTRKETLQSYYHYMRNDKAEQDALFNDLLIPVTYFFRDGKFFEKLTEEVFPALIQNSANNSLRIWIAGCSTGEEAYSMAILLHEYLSENNIRDLRVQIFASDISEKSIAKARSGIYAPMDIQQVSESRVNNYFIKREGSYHINKVIRDMCVFAVHNFIKDPPFASIDLISCRNVMIYLDSYLQGKVMSSFHYALKEKGFLFLGKSETAANAQNLFEPFEKHEKIYTRKFAPGRYVLEPFRPVPIHIRVREGIESKAIPETDFRKMASDLIFAKYTPAGVVINEHQEIVHFHGDTSYFLLPSPGKPNFNLLKMAREGIAFELRNALVKIKETAGPVIKENIIIKNLPYLVSFEIIPLDNHDNNLLVLFHKRPIPANDDEDKPDRNTARKQRITELEKELSQMREDIKRVTEEQQTAYEELQTTNEELLSSSEELQALNEELETSTEELQSNNEELMCVNDELLDRQEQLISLRNYSESIVKTIREPLVIIDKDFVIRSCNPAYYKYFGTAVHNTEGLSFFKIAECQWDIEHFKEQIHKVVSEKINVEDYRLEVVCPGKGKKVMIVNIRNIVDAKPAGMILIAIEDITALESKNELLLQKNEELEHFNAQLKIFSTAASHDLQDPLRKLKMLGSRIIESEKNLSEAGSQQFERMVQTVKNMDRLIENLIQYTRFTLPENEFKKTNLNAKLKKLAVDLNDELSDKDATFTVSALPEIKTLQYQIRQLFSNLISNSLKYAQDGIAPKINITSEDASAEEIEELGGNPDIDYIKIDFSDNGIGFGEDNKEKIFEPFFRLHGKDKYEGSGLGLALVKKIMENHNGLISVSSKPNSGTTIHLYFPVK
jgi:two-component system CheB/CheR fusion protein